MEKVYEIVIWLVVSIFLPAASPYFALFFLWKLKFKLQGEHAAKALRPVNAYKDGQLIWVALTTCFIAIYELTIAMMKGSNGWNVATLVGLIILLMCNGLLIGATSQSPSGGEGEGEGGGDRRALMRWSVWLTVWTGLGALAAHARLMLTS